MEHFMVKRAKLSKHAEDGGCDSTNQIEEKGQTAEVKIKQEGPASAMSVYTELLKSAVSSNVAEGLPIPTELPDVPFQPEEVPPYRDRRRPHLFQKKWYKEYPWLHYDASSQSMFCFQCISAIHKGVAQCPGQNIFVRGGFKNWKKGLERFRVHENSSLHRDTSDFSVRRLFGLKDKCNGVEGILTSINFLLGVSGDVKTPHLLELLELRQQELPFLREHLSRAGFSDADKQELIPIMTASTMRQVSAKIKEAGAYGLVLEKVKVAGQTMFAVSARTSRLMKAEEYYLGLYTEQNIMHELVNYLDADDLRLYSCDMVESKSIAEALEVIQPHVLHCPGPDLCGDLQEQLKTTDLLPTMILLHEITSFLHKNTTYVKDVPENQPLGPKKSTGNFKTISVVLTNYSEIIKNLESAVVTDPGSFIAHYLCSELKKRSTLFALLMCKVLLYPVENLNSIILKSNTNQSNRQAADSVLKILECSKTKKEFESLWTEFIVTCKTVNRDDPESPSEEKTEFETLYLDTIEQICGYLSRTFHNAAYDNLLLLEKALLSSEESASKEAYAILKENNINPDSLRMEKRMLQKMSEDDGKSSSLRKTISRLRVMTGLQGLLPETVKLVDLLMLARVDEAAVQDRRIKKLTDFLESNQSSDLVNELSILYVYREENLMNFTEVAVEYIESDVRRAEALFKAP